MRAMQKDDLLLFSQTYDEIIQHMATWQDNLVTSVAFCDMVV